MSSFSSPKKSIVEKERLSVMRSANSSQMKVRPSAIPSNVPSNKQLRQSMMISPQKQERMSTAQFGAASNARQSIARASMSFKISDSAEAGQMSIENDRLKTTLDILN